MEPYLRMPLVMTVVVGILASTPIVNAQTLTNAESKILVNGVRAKEEADRRNFNVVGVGDYRMNGVKLPDSFMKIPPNSARTCYFLGKVVEIENGKVVFDDQIESIVREVRCPSSEVVKSTK